ncbi:hypothetical protein MAH4_26620 [Sessilibacter sp. MAH4]
MAVAVGIEMTTMTHLKQVKPAGNKSVDLGSIDLDGVDLDDFNLNFLRKPFRFFSMFGAFLSLRCAILLRCLQK